MLKHAELFVLEAGDVLFLPALVYHVGRQEEFSVSVALPMYTYPSTRFLSGLIIPNLSSKTLPFDVEGMSSHIPLTNMSVCLQADLEKIARESFSQWLSHDLRKVISYYWFRLLSNGGWELSSVDTENLIESRPGNQDLKVNDQAIVKLVKPFKIYWEVGLDCPTTHVRVFLRGSFVIILFDKKVCSVFERLNTGEHISINGCQSTFLALKKLSQTNGLCLTN